MSSRIVDFTGQTLPKPAPAWAKNIGKTFFKVVFGLGGTYPVPDVPTGASLTDNDMTADAAVDLTNLWKVFTDRKRTVMDIDNMDRNDGIISQGLDIIADHATTYDATVNYRLGEQPGKVRPVNRGFEQGFRIITEVQEVQDVLNALIARLDLSANIWNIAREFVKYGVYLPEVMMASDHSCILALNNTSPHEIWPKTNEKGHKVPGWIYRRDRDIYASTTGNAGNYLVTAGQEMEDWQILPFIFGANSGFFTAPILNSIRYDWKRLQRIEDNMGIQRLRSTDRYVHRVPVTSNMSTQEMETTLRNYQQRITKRRILGPEQTLAYNDSPLQAITDFFIPQTEQAPALGGVTILNPSNAHLSNLTDVYYAREKILARLGVPITYLQIMSTQKTHLTASSGVQGVDKQFSKTLMRVQNTLRRGLGRLFDMELALHGITPKPGLYSIELPIITTKDALNDAKVSLANAQAAVYFSEAFGALPMSILSDLFLTLTTEEQQLMSQFTTKWDDIMVQYKMDALKMAAQPPGGNLGVAKAKQRVTGASGKSGNAAKSLGERTSEQKGATQSITIEDALSLYVHLAEGVEQQLLANGVAPEDIPSINLSTVQSELHAIALYDN